MNNNKTILARLIIAIENRDAEAASDLFADDVIFENVSEGESIHSKTAVKAKFLNFFANVCSIRWHIKRQLFDENIVITELENHLCFQEKKVILPMINIIELNHSKITLFRDYFDGQTLAKQLAG